MNPIIKLSSSFTTLIAILLLAVIEKPYNNHKGLHFYQTSWVTWEEQVFNRPFKTLPNHESLYGKNLENRIAQLISNYKTGLKKGHFVSLPERIVNESKKYGYDPLFLTAVIITESSFYNWAQSDKGALGLMQILPTTGKELANQVHLEWAGNPTLFDPEVNIALGAYYLNKLVLRFGDLGLALEAYNHGPTRLNRYLKAGLRPKRYSQKVFRHYSWLRSPSI